MNILFLDLDGLEPKRCIIVNPAIGMEVSHYEQLTEIFSNDNTRV